MTTAARTDPAGTADRPPTLAGPRLTAYALDALTYLALAALELPIGLALRGSAAAENHSLIWWLSAIPAVVAALIAARFEAGPRGATWGKRRLHLRVAAPGRSMSYPRALLRNLVKITLPWQLGHTVALAASWGALDRDAGWALAAATATNVLVALMVGMLVADGRPPHDRVAGSRVIRAAA